MLGVSAIIIFLLYQRQQNQQMEMMLRMKELELKQSSQGKSTPPAASPENQDDAGKETKKKK